MWASVLAPHRSGPDSKNSHEATPEATTPVNHGGSPGPRVKTIVQIATCAGGEEAPGGE
jgi:hypothetical protein